MMVKIDRSTGQKNTRWAVLAAMQWRTLSLGSQKNVKLGILPHCRQIDGNKSLWICCPC